MVCNSQRLIGGGRGERAIFTYLFNLQLLAETHCLFGLDLGLVTSQAQAHANGGVVGIYYSIVV